LKIIYPILCCCLIYGCASTSEKKVVNNPLLGVNEAAIDVVWAKQLTKRGHDRYAKLWPLVENEFVVVADKDGNVIKLDAKTGREVWRQQFSTSFSSGPVVSDNRVLLGTLNAEVYLLDFATGQLLWRSLVSSEVLAPPQLSGNMLVVQANDGKLLGLDAKDGKQVWVYDRQVPILSLRGTGMPIMVQDKVITGFANGKLVAVSLNDGKLLWEATIAVSKGRTELERMVDIDGEISVVDDILYVTSFRGRVAAVEVSTGALLWSRDMSSYSGLVIANDLLFLIDDKGLVWALNRADGATFWMQDKLAGMTLSRPTVVGDKVLVGDKFGNFYRLSRTAGRILDVVPYETLAQLSGLKSVVDELDGSNESFIMSDPEDSSVFAPIQLYQNNIVVAYQSGLLMSLSLPQ